MNTIGKILAFLNLVFALVIGGFLAIDFTTRTNWKTAHDSRVRELTAKDAEVGVWKEEAIRLAEEKQKQKSKLEDYGKNDVKISDDVVLKLLQKDNELEAQRLVLLQKESALKDSTEGSKRHAAEAAGLRQTINDRDGKILKQQEDLDKLSRQVVTLEAGFTTMKDRVDVANEEAKIARQELAKLMALGTSGGVATATPLTKGDRNAPNPPPVKVEGMVEKVDPSGYVQVNVGRDEGVQKGHTLEVYRLLPRPDYLGMIRIIDAEAHKSVGQLVRTNNKTVVRGDQVKDSIGPR